MYLHKLKIGNVELENNIFLAPMAGITDLPFRLICKRFNPGLVCTEMVSAKALMYGDEKTKLLLNTQNEKRPIAMQIFGSDDKSMEFATKYLNDIADIIDINMGCPAPKVVKNGDGSCLLLYLELAEKIVRTVVKNAKRPVTVKIRKGWDENNVVAVETAQMLENAGVSAITIHGRTRKEFYTGKCDLDIIKKVKEAVKIPVIGNGDVVDGETALKMFEYTGVDGIMIGRASMGNPFIFRQVMEYLKGERQDIYVPSNREKLDIILEHIDLEIKEKGEYVGIREMRKHLCAYLKGLPKSAEARVRINQILNQNELEEFIKEYFGRELHI